MGRRYAARVVSAGAAAAARVHDQVWSLGVGGWMSGRGEALIPAVAPKMEAYLQLAVTIGVKGCDDLVNLLVCEVLCAV